MNVQSLLGDASPLEIVASIGGVGSFIFAFSAFLKSRLKSLSDSRERERTKVEGEINRIKEAGTTISARGDVGFMVLIELNMHQSFVSYLRWLSVMFMVSFFGMNIVFIMFMLSLYEISRVNIIVGFVLVVFAFVLSVYYIYKSASVNKIMHKFSRDVYPIWSEALEKRPSKKPNTTGQ